MGAALSIQLLGAFGVELHGQPIPIKSLPRRKVRSVLKLLALEPSHALSRDVFIERLWADLDPTAAQAQVYNALYTLRKVLGEAVAPKLVSGLVRLEPQGGLEVDAKTFVELAQAGLATQDLERLHQAAAMISGEPLSEDLYEDWAGDHREQLLGLQVRVLERLADLDPPYAEALWQKLLRLDPTSDNAHMGLMRHWAKQGMLQQVFEQFERYCQMRREEFATEPSPDLVAWVAELRQPQTQTQSNLPAPTVALVGREHELAMIAEFWRDNTWRLLTLFGTGGNGKSRLALEAAHANRDVLPNGAFWVALESLPSTDPPTTRVLQTLGLPLTNSQAEPVLYNYLRDKELLLVLDNVEHLENIGVWIQTLLSSTPKIKILVTSRTLLHLSGEQILELHGLDASAATALFVQSAKRVQPHFAPNAAQEAQIAHLTQHLVGSPLAIELAASWLRLMPLEDIVQEVALDLDFLERPVQDRHQRHHSVRAVFESSWRLLEPPEQQTLVSLAVFVGGFTLGAAKTVSGASRAAIMALADCSLLKSSQSTLELHPLIRQFVLEQAAQSPEKLTQLRQQHATHYMDQLLQLPKRFQTKDPQAYLDTKRHVDGIFANARAAWVWTLEQHQDAALGAALSGLFVLHQLGNRLQELSGLISYNATQSSLLHARFAVFRGHCKGTLGLFKEAEAEFEFANQTQLPILEQIIRLHSLSNLYARSSRVSQALEFANQALELAKTHQNDFELSLSYLHIGDALSMAGRLEEAEQAFVAAQTGANIRLRSFLMVHLAALAGRRGELERAERELRSAIDLLTRLGDRYNLQVVQNNLATALQLQGKYQESLPILEQSAKEAQYLGDERTLAVILNSHMVSLQSLGQYTQALEIGVSNLERCRHTGNTLRLSHCLNRLGQIHFELGQLELALQHYQTALQENVQESREESQIGEIRTLIALGQPEQAKRLFLALQPIKARPLIVWKAIFALRFGKPEAAKDNLQTVLKVAREVSNLNASECLAEILQPLAQHQPEFALQLAHSLAQDIRSSAYAKKQALALVGEREQSRDSSATWQEVLAANPL
jgi:predicted ATPase/DNA-binding SARP family transcriptional activator